jgi:CO/xanthine dehydrogenase Mo-binding subunit
MKDGRRLVGSGFWQAPKPVFDRETGQGRTHHAFTFGTEIAEIEVDTETGEVSVSRIVAAFDVGKAINPQLVESQIEGGVVMGVGYALMEEIVLKQGIAQNANMTDYLVPTSVDVPRVESIIVEHPSELGPYGAKGIGEPPVNPAAAAIANALADASGVRFFQLPMDPERVRAGLQAALTPLE